MMTEFDSVSLRGLVSFKECQKMIETLLENDKTKIKSYCCHLMCLTITLMLVIMGCLDLLFFYKQKGEFLRVKHVHIKWKFIKIGSLVMLLVALCSFCCIMAKLRNSFMLKLEYRERKFRKKLQQANDEKYEDMGLLWVVGPYSAWIALTELSYVKDLKLGAESIDLETLEGGKKNSRNVKINMSTLPSDRREIL